MVGSPSRNRAFRHHRRWINLVTLALSVLFADLPAHAEVMANINTRITNPGFTVIDTSVTGLPLMIPDDSETRFASTNFAGPILSVKSTVVANLSNNAVAVGGSWMGLSAEGVASQRNALAGGAVVVNDEITITSPTLTDGTPVTVTFSFFALHTSVFGHSLAVPTTNNSGVDYQFSGQITNTPLAGQVESVIISNVNHRFQDSSASPVSQTGIMNPATPQLDVDIDSSIGSTISLNFDVIARIGGGVVSTELNNLAIQTGIGTGALAVAFGASPTSGDVNLNSQLFSGMFPTAPMATLANAQAAISMVPSPSTISIFSVGMMMLAGVRRCDRLHG